MSYKPDFNDPRVLTRIKSSIEWVDKYVGQRECWLSAREIQRQFGSQSRPLGLWLRNRLLICVNSTYDPWTKRCKTYRLNEEGYKEITTRIGSTTEYTVSEELAQVLDTGEFAYSEKSNRLYHPLQNLPKRVKRTILKRHAYDYEYDIECAAHSLITQHVRVLGYKMLMPYLETYVADRQSVREQLALELNLDKSTVKQILHALLFGGKLSTWHTNQIYAYVNYNTLMITQLKQNEFIQQYREEVRQMWKFVRTRMNLNKGERLNAKKKSELYVLLEKSVRDQIQRYLKKTKNKYFLEHDGWTCEKVVNTDELVRVVERTTGFKIKLEWTIYE